MAETDLTEPPVAGNEVDTLIGELERVRRTFAWKAGGLDAAGLRATTAASSMTLGGLTKHLAMVEDDYFSRRLWANEYQPPFDAVDFDADPDWEWRTAADDSPEELRAMWENAVERSRALIAKAIAEGGLDRPAAYWPRDVDPKPTLRRLLVDIIEEYARHTGHADFLREAVDGLVGETPPRQG